MHKIRTENNIEIKNGYGYVELLNRNKEITGCAIIDIDDIELISKYRWYKSKDGYAVSTDKEKSFGTSYITMHGVVLSNLCGFKITPDHKNLNKLDNRKNNLRLSMRSQQQMNHNKPSNNTSGVIGVNWDKRQERWLARINIDKVLTFLGIYINFNDAVIARLKAEQKYYGEFAPQKHLYTQFGLECD